MRTNPNNSPHAAARIVALAMLADGHLCKTELDALDCVDVHTQLGLPPAELHAIVHALCEDLLSSSHGTWEEACRVDSGTLAALPSEIDDPALRVKVLRLCLTVLAADEHLADGESIVLIAATKCWGLPRELRKARAATPRTAHV